MRKKKTREIHIPKDRMLDYETWVEYRDYAYRSSTWYAENYDGHSGKVRERLLKKGFVDEEVITVDEDGVEHSLNFIDYCIQRLTEDLYINDENYIERFFERRLNNGKSVFFIKQELYAKGLDRGLIEEISQDFDNTEALEIAYEKIVNSYAFQRIEEPFKRKQKIYQGLAQRGFSSSDISKVMKDTDIEAD